MTDKMNNSENGKGTSEEKKLTVESFLKEWVFPLAIEAIVILLLIKFVFFMTFVPSGSMKNTIAEGSWLFATRMYNATENVKHGDIIVFESNNTEDKLLIKRAIGLPGDIVEFSADGTVWLNGKLLDEPYVSSKSNYEGIFYVPEGHFLFVGDNRGGSTDARYWKDPYISEEDIVGKAHFTLWPISNIGLLK